MKASGSAPQSRAERVSDRYLALDNSRMYYAAMNDCPPGTLTVQVLGALHSLEGRLESRLDPIGLSLAKLGALAKLAAAPEPLPLRTLAELCACVRSNITQLVDRLEADKLVVRTDDPQDRRSVRAALTPEGRSRHAAGMRLLEEAEQELLARLSPEQQRDLGSLLDTLRTWD
jgi:DNA-binding MarR family transcriptional regulator